MKASFSSRRIISSVLAATLVALPSNGALAAPAPAPTTTPAPKTTTAPTTSPATTPAPTATPAPTSTPAPTATPAPTTDPNAPVDPNADPNREADTTTAITAPGETPTPTDGEEPPAVEEPPPAEVTPPPPPLPEGPERPPEPTVANGKYKAKGTGLLIAGGTLLGVGVASLLTTVFLTRCPELEDSFACKNQQHNTFAVPATGALTLLGTVLLLVGVGYRVRYKRWERWTPNNAKASLTPTFNRGGAGVSYTLKF